MNRPHFDTVIKYLLCFLLPCILVYIIVGIAAARGEFQ